MRPAGKLKELAYEMDRYRWNLLGLCEVRWNAKYSGEENKQEHHEISSTLISIRLRADPFKITVIQVYAPTTDYSDDQIEDFYSQLQKIINQAPKKDILIVQGDWNAKVGKYTQEN